MDSCFEQFEQSNLSLESFGIYPWIEGDEPYFCTPKNAVYIGRTGVDGIHYCFAKECGTVVFAISPCNEAGEQIHPVARNFEEFLALLIACKGEAALEQSWMWDKAAFEAFCSQQETNEELEQLSARIEEELGVQPEYQPFECLEEIRNEVDYTGLQVVGEMPQPDQLEREPCEWQVQYENQGEPGREIFLQQRFCWAGREWLVPSAYLCEKGIVIDFCMKTAQEVERDFLTRWGITGREEPNLTEEEEEQMQNENPLAFEFASTLEINGRESDWTESSGRYWSGCLPEFADCQRETGCEWMEHYHLDQNACWSFTRIHYPWPDGERPELDSLWVRLEETPKDWCGAKFTTGKAGETVEILNPVNQKVYTLTIEKLEQETMDQEIMPDGWKSPNHLCVMEYSLSPELAQSEFYLRDCAPSDGAVQVNMQPTDSENAAIGIIGGADGPTAVFVQAAARGQTERTVCSSLHFDPVDRVEWKPVFRMKTVEDIRICLGEA